MISLTNTSISVALVSLALAGTAAADVHINSTGHGGQALGSGRTAVMTATPAVTLGGASAQDQPVVGSVSRNRRTIALNAAYIADCGSEHPAFGMTKFAPAKVKKTGRYSIARTMRMRFDDGYTMVESYKASGRVTKRGSAGTLAVTANWFNPDGSQAETCSTGVQRFRLYDSGTFAGTTSKGFPVVLQHSPGRDRVTAILIPWTAECGSGWMWGTASLQGPITRSGAFGGTLTPTLDLGDGQVAHETQILSGSLLARRVFGTWTVTASITDAAGAEVDTCDSGVLGFALK